MQFYDYIYRDSIIHKLDPRTKLLWLVVLSFLVFTTKNNTQTLLIITVLLTTMFLSKLPLNAVWKTSRFFIITFTIGYIVLFSLLLWNIQQGIIQGFWFALKFLVLIISSIIFAMSTSPRDLMLSLVKLKVPYEIAFMLTIAIRFVPVIIRELNYVIDAQKARAHKIIFSFKHPIKSLETTLPIIIPTFHLLLIKAFDLSLAIEARGFQILAPRTFPPRLKFKTKDGIATLLLIGLAVGLQALF